MLRVTICCSFLSLLLLAKDAFATSIKMDFLPLGDVRVDPVINPDCLSDHVHTFYGANKLRPETTYADLRSAEGNSGNVEENKSLYWHPTVYRVENGIYTKAEIYFASAYYIWTTGQATAFNDGFKMVAGVNGDPLARASFECVGCTNSEVEDGCLYTEFPTESCEELEVSMAFPTCWDGVNSDSDDHMSHVSYDIDGGFFDGDCPETHPVKIPEIQLFFRISPYPGGTHAFADGTSYYHADYFSGWDQQELQHVLDNCENESDAASPDAWCEDFLTFRDAPKSFGEDSSDENIKENLQTFEPEPYDFSTITDELIDNISELPRGACTGTLKPEGSSPTTAPTLPTPTPPTTTTSPTPKPTTLAPSAPTGECSDSSLRFNLEWNDRKIRRDCNWVQNKATRVRCEADGVAAICPDTCEVCGICEDSYVRFKIFWNGRNIMRDCNWVGNKATTQRCSVEGVAEACRSTCEVC